MTLRKTALMILSNNGIRDDHRPYHFGIKDFLSTVHSLTYHLNAARAAGTEHPATERYSSEEPVLPRTIAYNTALHSASIHLFFFRLGTLDTTSVPIVLSEISSCRSMQ